MSKSRLSYGRPRWDLRLSRPGGSGLEVARSLRPPDGAPRHRAVGVCHLWGVHGRFRRRQAFGPVNSAEPGASPVTQPASGCAKPEARTDIHLPAAGQRAADTGPGPPRAARPRRPARDGTDPRSARQAAAVGPLGLRNRGASRSDVSASCRFGGP